MRVYAPRVKETTTTEGTGTLNLGGAVDGFQGFVAGVGDTNTCKYLIVDDANNWEIGIGTVTDASPDTLSRDTVEASSNSGSLVDFGVGTKYAAVVMTGADIASGDQELYFPATSMVSATTNGAADGSVETTTNAIMIETKNFDAATDEFVQFSLVMPETWDGGDILASFAWSHPAATTFDVVWGIQALALADDDAIDQAWGTAQTVTDSGGTTDDLYISADTSAVTAAGSPAGGQLVYFRVYRDADSGSDTLDVDARLHGVTLTITTTAGNVS